MTTFSYTALEPSGKKKTGVVDAVDKDAAIAQLSADGRYVLEIKPQVATKSVSLSSGRKATKQDIALFTRRLADLSDAGLPLDRVLQVTSEQSESPQLTQITEQALEDVRSGLPVSAALAKHPKLFPTLFTETLKAGETSGQFSDVAARLADFQEKEVARRSQIISALVYPMVLATVATGVIIFLVLFVVPRLKGVLDSLGTELPVSTQILMSSASFMTSNWLLILGSIVGAVVVYKAWIATDAGALAKDKLVMAIPLIGKVVGKAVLSRYARILGTLVYGGVPILEALKLSGMASGSRVFLTISDSVAESVRDGKAINQAMRDTEGFPPVLIHMVAIGEETGDLPKMLGRVADSMDFEVDTGMRRIVAVVEPMIMLVMAVFVGFVVLSIVLPIYQAQESVK